MLRLHTLAHKPSHSLTCTPIVCGVCSCAGQVLLPAFVILKWLEVDDLHGLRLRGQLQNHHRLTITQLEHTTTTGLDRRIGGEDWTGRTGLCSSELCWHIGAARCWLSPGDQLLKAAWLLRTNPLPVGITFRDVTRNYLHQRAEQGLQPRLAHTPSRPGNIPEHPSSEQSSPETGGTFSLLHHVTGWNERTANCNSSSKHR